MGLSHAPRVITDGLTLALDAAPNPRFSNYKGRSVAFVESNDDGFNVSNSTGWFNPNNTSQWTLEGWILNPSSTNKFSIYSGTNGSVANFGCSIGGAVAFQSGNGAWSWVTNTTIVADTGSPTGWNHFAFTKNGSTFEVFLNGSRIYTGTPTFGTGGTGGSIHLQSYFSDGNYYEDAAGLSNVRYVTGSVLYSGTSYTVPTEPLTAISGTQLLVYQDTTFTDASSNSLTLTKQNSPTISYNGPFSDSGWTDLTNRGNSGTLTNGPVLIQEPKLEPFGGAGGVQGGGTTSDYLSVSASGHSDFSLDGDFTTEWWHYRAAANANNGYMWTIGDSNTSTGLELYWGSTGSALNLFTNGGSNSVTATAATGWHHYVVVRSGNTIKVYYDGTEGGSFTNSNTFSGNVTIGGEYYGGGITGGMHGPMSQFRLVKGTALYTSNFTPPRKKLEVTSDTVLLTCEKGTIRDRSSSAHAITINGDAKSISGASYFEFDGTDDYILLDSGLGIGTDDFAISVWVKFDSVSGVSGSANYRTVLSSYSGGLGYIFGLWISGNPVFEHYMDGTSYKGNTTIVAGTWYNMVSTRLSGDLYLYLNGSLDNTPVSASTKDMADTATPRIGWIPSASQNGRLDGAVSDLKIYKGKGLTAAEVTQNFNALRGRYGI